MKKGNAILISIFVVVCALALAIVVPMLNFTPSVSPIINSLQTNGLVEFNNFNTKKYNLNSKHTSYITSQDLPEHLVDFASQKLIVYTNYSLPASKEYARVSYLDYYYLYYKTVQDCYDDYLYYSSLTSVNSVYPDIYLTTDEELQSNGLTDSFSYASYGGDAMQVKEYSNYLLNYVGENNLNQPIVVVIDTGLTETHSWFTNRVYSEQGLNRNLDGNNDDVTDNEGHGTHVAGTIVDITLKNVKVLPLKVSEDRSISLSTVIDALGLVLTLKTRANNPLNIVAVNMSLGANDPRFFVGSSIYNLINAPIVSLYNSGVLSVVSAGNEAKDVAYCVPANCEKAITVSSCGSGATFSSSFSNYGEYIDVCAPGEAIKSAKNNSTNETIYKSGTSMSAPHISAVVAMLNSADRLSPQRCTELITDDFCVDYGDSGKDDNYGYGILNMAKWLNGITTLNLGFSESSGKKTEAFNLQLTATNIVGGAINTSATIKYVLTQESVSELTTYSGAININKTSSIKAYAIIKSSTEDETIAISAIKNATFNYDDMVAITVSTQGTGVVKLDGFVVEDGSELFHINSTKRYTFVPDELSRLVKLVVDGVTYTGDDLQEFIINGYVFNSLVTDHTMLAVFSNTFSCEISTSAGVSINYATQDGFAKTITDGIVQITNGSTLAVSFDVDSNYYFSAVTLNGNQVDLSQISGSGNTKVFTLEGVNADYSIGIICNKYLVVKTQIIGGVGTITQTAKKQIGEAITIQIQPASGYILQSIEIKKQDDTLNEGATTIIQDDDQLQIILNNGYTLSKITNDYLITANLKQVVFNVDVSFNHSDSGVTSQLGNNLVNMGDDFTLTYTTNANYEFAYLIVDGEIVQDDDNSYTLSNVQSNHTIVIYNLAFYNITAPNYSVNGSITQSEACKQGTQKTFVATPDEGYKVKSFIVDGVDMGSITSFTFSDINQEHTIDVKFEKISYKFNITATKGGSYDTLESVKVVYYNDVVTIVLYPSDGYKVKNIVVNGKEYLVNDDSFTISNIKQDTDVKINFEKQTSTISIVLFIAVFALIIGSCVTVIVIVLVKRHKNNKQYID